MDTPEGAQITDLYDVDDELEALLSEVYDKTTVKYTDQSDEQIGGTLTAKREEYTVSFEDFELTGYRTTFAGGVLLSLEGHLGLAATLVIVNATIFGKPTLLYIDELPPQTPLFDQYQDLSAEWYTESAREAGLPETRLRTRHDQFDSDEITLSQVEDWVRTWLSLD